MKKETQTLIADNDLLVDLTFHNLPASLLADFAEKIVHPHYNGNLNAAFQDLIQKKLTEQNFANSHISNVGSAET